MAMYSVTGADGRVYGPIDETTLLQWAREGRMVATTQVRCEETRATVMAGSLPFLAAIFRVAPPVVTPLGPLPPLAPPGGVPATHHLTNFPVAVVVLLHFVTCGIFTTIWFQLMHGSLPKVRPDDPSAGKAVGFMFIPFFNIYWFFFAWLRLMKRLNEQRQLRGLPETDLTGLFITAGVIMFIPYVGLISSFILFPIFTGLVQSSVNGLVSASQAAPAGVC